MSDRLYKIKNTTGGITINITRNKTMFGKKGKVGKNLFLLNFSYPVTPNTSAHSFNMASEEVA
jgi:hypothetical protein